GDRWLVGLRGRSLVGGILRAIALMEFEGRSLWWGLWGRSLIVMGMRSLCCKL
ncbi:MAG: hypothetical protein F6K29_35140, partial [Okeania sp. SIO2G5]|nr:hypothetical protein [Okeania sp. SIO2G5]